MVTQGEFSDVHCGDSGCGYREIQASVGVTDGFRDLFCSDRGQVLPRTAIWRATYLASISNSTLQRVPGCQVLTLVC